ncbi:FSD1 protein, partial [Drymodes brunneopygia]|nr:FSD1 protein [Drymodes brunneopygia]
QGAGQESLRKIITTLAVKNEEIQNFIYSLKQMIQNVEANSARAQEDLEAEFQSLYALLDELKEDMVMKIKQERASRTYELQVRPSQSPGVPRPGTPDLLCTGTPGQLCPVPSAPGPSPCSAPGPPTCSALVTMAPAFRLSLKAKVSDNMSHLMVDFAQERRLLQALAFLPGTARPGGHGGQGLAHSGGGATGGGSARPRVPWGTFPEGQEGGGDGGVRGVGAVPRGAVGSGCHGWGPQGSLGCHAGVSGCHGWGPQGSLGCHAGVSGCHGWGDREGTRVMQGTQRGQSPWGDAGDTQRDLAGWGQDRPHRGCPGQSGGRAPSGDTLIDGDEHYWEVRYDRDSKAFGVGVAYRSLGKFDQLGKTSASWCLHLNNWLQVSFSAKHNNKAKALDVPVPDCIGVHCNFHEG